MGYRTSITLALYGEQSAMEAVENEMRSVWEKDLADDILNNDAYIKWPWVEGDFFKIARNNPNCLIVVNGYGDDQDDIWEARWKGNEYEYQQTSIPPFKNPSLQIPNPRTF